MPSALSTKGTEYPDNGERFSQVVEKKIRNLEKRKTKLLSLLEQKRAGKTLDADQDASVKSLPLVESNLEQLKEILPQFKTIITDNEKLKKKQAKRDEATRSAADFKRIRGVISLSAILSRITPQIKEALLEGLHGLTLNEKDISILDTFSQLVDTVNTPWNVLEEHLDTVTLHHIAFLDNKDKVMEGETKYSDVNALLEKLKEHQIFDPDYKTPEPELEPEPEVEEEEEEEEQEDEKIAESSDLDDIPAEPTEPETESEEKLLNGETATDEAPAGDNAMINFMQDSHLDRTDSQLSPHAPEFQPLSSPDQLNSSDKATFGTFSQEETSSSPPNSTPASALDQTDPVSSDPAVMTWSTGAPAEQPPQTTSQPDAENPWSKPSTIDWGNSSLTSEPSTTTNVWSNNTPVQAWASANPSNPQHQTHLENGNTEDGKWGDGDISEPVMKDQTTQKLDDDDGFTEQRKRGSNRQRYNANRGGTSYRGNNRGRYNTSRRYNNNNNERSSSSRDNRNDSRGGYQGRRGSSSSNRGNPNRGSYRGNASRGPKRGSFPSSGGAKTATVAS